MRVNFSLYSLCRLTVAFVWFYHGLVPKLLGPHEDELSMNMALGLNVNNAFTLSYFAGIAEIIFSVVIIVCWRQRWPLLITAGAMIGLLIFSIIVTPQLAVAAFNPVTTNICVLSLAVVAYKLHIECGRSDRFKSEIP